MRVAVIGAGAAGATAAYQLAKQGIDVALYEAAPFVGGLARSFRLWNQTVDLGPHRFFSRDRRVNELWLEIVGRDYAMVDRLTRIFYQGRFFYYPLRPGNALRNLGLAEALRCVGSYAKEKFSPTPQDGTFESWVTNRFGHRLYRIFFKTYSEKLWGIPCTELDSAFAAQRIRKISLGAAIVNAFWKDAGKTFVDQFAYPVEGTGSVYNRMVQAITERGGKVFLQTPVRRVVMEQGRATALEFENGTRQDYDHIVSSMPITLLVQRLDGTPEPIKAAAASLKFRNTILVYLRVQSDAVFPDNWLYVHSPDLQTGRITNFRNWTPSLYGDEKDSILAMEYWANDEDPLWHKSPEELIALALREIRATGLVGDVPIPEGHVEMVRRSYPVYRKGYQEQIDIVREYLSGIAGLQAIGRYGAFKYNNQDHSILMGLLAAENIVGTPQHDLWEVNADYESYQEEALITAAGLKMIDD